MGNSDSRRHIKHPTLGFDDRHNCGRIERRQIGRAQVTLVREVAQIALITRTMMVAMRNVLLVLMLPGVSMPGHTNCLATRRSPGVVMRAMAALHLQSQEGR